MLALTQADAGRTLGLEVGEVIELRLAENPSTGFRWEIAADGRPACVIVGSTFAPAGSMPGAGGERRWQIRGSEPGTCELKLIFHRSFEHTPPAQTFDLHVVVSPQ